MNVPIVYRRALALVVTESIWLTGVVAFLLVVARFEPQLITNVIANNPGWIGQAEGLVIVLFTLATILVFMFGLNYWIELRLEFEKWFGCPSSST